MTGEVVLQEASEKLKKFVKNSEWFMNHYDELKDKYNGEYVAINVEVNNTKPIDHDKDDQSLIKRLREEYGDLSSFVIEPVYEQQMGVL